MRTDGDPIAVGLDFQKGVRGQKAVPPNLLAPHDAFRQARASARIKLVESGDRRERVAHESAVDGHQVNALGEVAKSLEFGKVLHDRSIPFTNGDDRRQEKVQLTNAAPTRQGTSPPRRASRVSWDWGLTPRFSPPEWFRKGGCHRRFKRRIPLT